MLRMFQATKLASSRTFTETKEAMMYVYKHIYKISLTVNASSIL